VDESGRPSKRALEHAWEADPASIALYAFDLLNWEGYNTRELTLRERKALLRSLLPPSGSALYVDSVAERGRTLAAEAARLGLDTLLAKRADSRYEAGPSKQWKRIRLSGQGAGGEGESLPAEELQRKPGFKLSNPGKVLWPAEGYTKRDLFAYYEAVAEHLLAHVRGRPMHLHRFPNGIEEKSFYQKRPPETFPSWIAQVQFPETDERYLLCNDRPTLLYLANLASIDLHPWLSRADSPGCPDWAVIDIDAKESSFETAVKIARKAGSLLRGLGVRSFVKTSGGSGLHVYVPLAPSYSYEQSRMFTETVARVLAMENRDSATVERNPERRSGKVYVDFLQNRRGQTVVPPYSARPVAGARVSMPLEWDELRSALSPDRFTIKTAVGRLEELGDLFRPVLELDQELLPAIEALQQYMKAGGRALE
jgi:DNA ligase D-like protein (predicted polymerase)